MSRALVGVAWDPGAARAVAPVIAEAARQGWQTMLATSTAAAAVAYRVGVRHVRTLAAPSLASSLPELAPPGVVVVTGVSDGDSAEKHAIAACRARAARTCAVLDTWGGYAERLMGSVGRRALPDVLAVMNQEASRAIANERFFEGELIVTGHPGLCEFENANLSTRSNARSSAREQLGLPLDGTRVVFFASQPLAQQFGHQLGYDQYDAIAMLRAVMPADGILVVGRHPREELSALAERCPDDAVVLSAYDPLMVYAAADVVASCFSAALTEAVVAGRPAVSLQPGAAGHDVLWTNRCGATRPAYDSRELALALEDAWGPGCDPTKLAERRSRLAIPPDATSQVIRILEALASR